MRRLYKLNLSSTNIVIRIWKKDHLFGIAERNMNKKDLYTKDNWKSFYPFESTHLLRLIESDAWDTLIHFSFMAPYKYSLNFK